MGRASDGAPARVLQLLGTWRERLQDRLPPTPKLLRGSGFGPVVWLPGGLKRGAGGRRAGQARMGSCSSTPPCVACVRGGCRPKALQALETIAQPNRAYKWRGRHGLNVYLQGGFFCCSPEDDPSRAVPAPARSTIPPHPAAPLPQGSIATVHWSCRAEGTLTRFL